MTTDEVWSALAEIPDPEIPAISLVDLGVVKSVEIEGERVRIELIPTFIGCPALERMQAEMATAVEELGGETRSPRVIPASGGAVEDLDRHGRTLATRPSAESAQSVLNCSNGCRHALQ